ncbi:hypothetical protein HON22_04165 [Candidatus Peregrinibacteria bacterium]|jgi:hypothetical protein|nr:hypothetical protein [Candidatus Peregrinibacteria bacterium]
MKLPFFKRKHRRENSGKTLRFSVPVSRSSFANDHRKRILKKKLHFLKPFLYFLLVMGGFGFLFFSPYFQVTNIEVERKNLSIDSSVIDIFLSREVVGENIFRVSPEGLSLKLQEEFLQWKSIKVLKKYPRSLQVFVENYSAFASIKIKTLQKKEMPPQENPEVSEPTELEKLPPVVAQEVIEENEYIINELGDIAYPEIGDAPSLHIIYDELFEDEITIGKSIVVSEDMKQIQEIIYILLNDYDLATKDIHYFKAGKEAHFNLYQFSLWFDLTQNISKQLGKFDQALRAVEKGSIEYFDLRISERVIYKEKGE